MAYTNPSFTKLSSRATRTVLGCGSKTDWYIHENIDACFDAYWGTDSNKPQTDPNKMRTLAWFAEVGWNDAFADYRSNSWTGSIVSGPYPTYEEAAAAARDYAAAENAKRQAEAHSEA